MCKCVLCFPSYISESLGRSPLPHPPHSRHVPPGLPGWWVWPGKGSQADGKGTAWLSSGQVQSLPHGGTPQTPPATLLQRLRSLCSQSLPSPSRIKALRVPGTQGRSKGTSSVLRKPGLGIHHPPSRPLPPPLLTKPRGRQGGRTPGRPLEERPLVHPQGYGPHFQLQFSLGQGDALSHLVSRQTKDLKPGFQND